MELNNKRENKCLPENRMPAQNGFEIKPAEHMMKTHKAATDSNTYHFNS